MISPIHDLTTDSVPVLIARTARHIACCLIGYIDDITISLNRLDARHIRSAPGAWYNLDDSFTHQPLTALCRHVRLFSASQSKVKLPS